MDVSFISAALVLPAVVALLYAGIRFIQAQQAKKESGLLSQILELRATMNSQPENLAELEKLSGNGKYARLGYVLLATYWVENDDLEKAKDSLGKVPSTPTDFIYYQARDLLAQVNALEKSYDQAITLFTEIEQANPKTYALDAVLFHKAEALEAKGDKPEALTLYKKLQEEYPQSYFGYDAGEKVRKIEAAQ